MTHSPIEPLDLLDTDLASLTAIVWRWLSSFRARDGQPWSHKLKKLGGQWLGAIALTLLVLVFLVEVATL